MHFLYRCPTLRSMLASFRSKIVQPQLLVPISGSIMTGKDTQDLDARAAAGEMVVPGGTGGKSVEAQQHLAEGRSKGGHTRAEQLGHEGYVKMGKKGGQTRAEELGHKRYAEMGKKGGSATKDMSGGEAAKAAGREIDESKFTKH